MKADTDEKSVTYTRRFLNDLGINPPIDTKHIEKVIAACDLDPLYFLAHLQKEVRMAESKKSSTGSEISKYDDKLLSVYNYFKQHLKCEISVAR